MHAGGNYFWDPLAAVALAAPDTVTVRTERLRGTRDGRLVRDGAHRALRVAVAADRARFERELLRTVAGDSRANVPRLEIAAAIVCERSRCTYRGPAEAEAGGEGAFDTVNRSRSVLTHVIGRLHEGRGVDDLRRLVRANRPFEPPVWFSTVATGTTPPESRMTWLVSAEPGEYAILATGPGGTQVLAGITAS
jgi:hypothetical protein